MIGIGDKVKVLFKAYEDEGWASGMDRWIGDGVLHVVTRDHGVGYGGLHRVDLDYDYSFPVICLEIVEKGNGVLERPRVNSHNSRFRFNSGDTIPFATQVNSIPVGSTFLSGAVPSGWYVNSAGT